MTQTKLSARGPSADVEAELAARAACLVLAWNCPGGFRHPCPRACSSFVHHQGCVDIRMSGTKWLPQNTLMIGIFDHNPLREGCRKTKAHMSCNFRAKYQY